MSTIVNKSDGTLLTQISEATIDSSTTSLSLTGRGATGYSKPMAENFVRLMENFASSISPKNPLRGQLWYDINAGALKVFSGVAWGAVAATPSPSTSTPSSIAAGTGITATTSNGTTTIALASTAVSPDTYSNANITVDASGRIVSASNGVGGGTGGTGGGTGLTPTGVQAGSYTSANITVNQFGQITVAANGVTPTGTATSPTAGSIPLTAIADVASGTIVGRTDFGPGAPSAVTLTSLLDKLGTIEGQTLVRGKTEWTASIPMTSNSATLPSIQGPSLLGNETANNQAARAISLTQLLDTVVNQTGAMLCRGPSGWTNVVVGTTGQILYSRGSSNTPYWGDPVVASGVVVGIRLVYVADVGASATYSGGDTGAGTTDEPYYGAVITGVGSNGTYFYGVRYRYLQYNASGNWYTASTN